jgi:hypothetical protein
MAKRQTGIRLPEIRRQIDAKYGDAGRPMPTPLPK